MVLHTIQPMPRHIRALANWTALNDFLRTANLDDCRVLIKLESTECQRETFIKRINGRYRMAQKIRERRGRK